MVRYDEIRAFTGEEVGRVESELQRVWSVIQRKKADLSEVKLNPANYLIETQRDAITRMENGITQDEHVFNQLAYSRDETIESGDTDKLARWFDLAATVGDASDLSIWREQKAFAQTSEMVKTVASETARQAKEAVKNPFGVPWWVWAGGIAALWLGLGRRR